MSTDKFDALRMQLCKQYDDVVDAASQDDKRVMRNALDALHGTVKAMAEFDGDVQLFPLPANYSTLNRYIP